MKTIRDSVEVHAECKSVLVHLMTRTGRQKVEYLFVIDGKLIPMMTNKRKCRGARRVQCMCGCHLWKISRPGAQR